MATNDEIDDRLKQLAIAAKNHQSKLESERKLLPNYSGRLRNIKSLTVPEIKLLHWIFIGKFVQKPNKT